MFVVGFLVGSGRLLSDLTLLGSRTQGPGFCTHALVASVSPISLSFLPLLSLSDFLYIRVW